jgi:hypothetical protein
MGFEPSDVGCIHPLSAKVKVNSDRIALVSRASVSESGRFRLRSCIG